MMRNLFILTTADLASAVKNKTIYLILFIPFFVFVTLSMIDKISGDANRLRVCLIEQVPYSTNITDQINTIKATVDVTWSKSEDDARRLLKEKAVDGVLLVNNSNSDAHTLLVLKKESIQTIGLVEYFSALQKVTESSNPDWIADIEALYSGNIQEQTLPTWILMIVLLIGFIILPAQVAEEKEKKLLLALLQTPISEIQWLVAKLITGMILVLIAVLFLHLFGRFGVENLFDYVLIIVLGGFCFSAYGILLGFLCQNQSSARTLGVVFYLPHLLPSALSDFSQQLTAIAPLLPSYQFFEPLKMILLENGRISDMSLDWIYLLFVGVLASCLSYWLMKKRWLMK